MRGLRPTCKETQQEGKGMLVLGEIIALPYETSYVDDYERNECKRSPRKTLSTLDESADAHEPVLITGPRANAVLIGEDDWNAIQETMHLLSVPGMRESIVGGLATPVEECETEPGW